MSCYPVGWEVDMKVKRVFFGFVVMGVVLVSACGEDDGKDDTAGVDCDTPSDEVCDGIDNDCDGQIDEGALDAVAWFGDGDGDGYGLDSSIDYDCDQPVGYVAEGGDCDDEDPSLNPETYWYADADGDGFGDPDTTVQQCVQPSGYVSDDTDCDDTRDDVNPGEEEQCDEVDHDCTGDHGMVDEDGDGVAHCEGDCDDNDPTIYPGADEYCDGIDNDCDHVIDEDDAIDAPTWYLDYDLDGYGTDDTTMTQCEQPDSFVDNADDCDDLDDAVNPGATEVEGDGVDNDCDGDID
jgi:large repetitive protein